MNYLLALTSFVFSCNHPFQAFGKRRLFDMPIFVTARRKKDESLPVSETASWIRAYMSFQIILRWDLTSELEALERRCASFLCPIEAFGRPLSLCAWELESSSEATSISSSIPLSATSSQTPSSSSVPCFPPSVLYDHQKIANAHLNQYIPLVLQACITHSMKLGIGRMLKAVYDIRMITENSRRPHTFFSVNG